MIEALDSLLIARTRDEIDALDSQLATLLLQRRALSERIIFFRLAGGGNARDPARERCVLERAAMRAGSDSEARYLLAMFGCLLGEAPIPGTEPG